MQLALVHAEGGFAGDGEFQHPRPLAASREGAALALPRAPGGHEDHALQPEGLAHLDGEPQVAEVDRVEGAAEKAEGGGQKLSRERARLPSTIHFCEVSPSSPTGPRAWSLLVEMPISAPSPYSKPSAKRVDAFTMTEAESTSRRKRCARPQSSVTMASVCCEP